MMLHTLIPYWETYISPQAASTPLEYLMAASLLALMVVALERLPDIQASRTN